MKNLQILELDGSSLFRLKEKCMVVEIEDHILAFHLIKMITVLLCLLSAFNYKPPSFIDRSSHNKNKKSSVLLHYYFRGWGVTPSSRRLGVNGYAGNYHLHRGVPTCDFIDFSGFGFRAIVLGKMKEMFDF